MDGYLLNVLMKNRVFLKSEITGREMTVDEFFVLGGEFVVCKGGSDVNIYRGTDFDEAMKYMNGEK